MSISPCRYATATESRRSILTDARLTPAPLAAPAGAGAPSARPEQRIDVDTVDADAPVQMRPGRQAGAAHTADDVARVDALTGCDVQRGHMHVEGQGAPGKGGAAHRNDAAREYLNAVMVLELDDDRPRPRRRVGVGAQV